MRLGRTDAGKGDGAVKHAGRREQIRRSGLRTSGRKRDNFRANTQDASNASKTPIIEIRQIHKAREK